VAGDPDTLLSQIEQSFLNYKPQKIWLKPLLKRSAVAMILQQRAEGLSILMIKRAERDGDPWSGHMAFPGGRMDKGDAHGLAVASRETEEEVGLTLDETVPCIGRLSELRARSRGWSLPLIISPYVFRIEEDPVLTPNHEVAEVIWVPLDYVLDHSNRETMHFKRGKFDAKLPFYMYKNRRIWGLSLLMLDELAELISK